MQPIRGALGALSLCALLAIAAAACGGGAAEDRPDSTLRDVTRVVGTPSAGGADAAEVGPQPLLPDLRVLPMREMYIEPGANPGSRVLRFSTGVFNDGEGDLSLQAERDESTGQVVATQFVMFDDGSTGSREVGRFVFDGSHAHWHMQDFMVLDVRAVNDDLAAGDTLLSTGKATFCAVDEVPEREDAPPPTYLSCDDPAQGISRGWSDTYAAALPGQEIDISALPDGVYALHTIVDPDDRLMESNEDNNDAIEFVRIEGMTVTPLAE